MPGQERDYLEDSLVWKTSNPRRWVADEKVDVTYADKTMQRCENAMLQPVIEDGCLCT